MQLRLKLYKKMYIGRDSVKAAADKLRRQKIQAMSTGSPSVTETESDSGNVREISGIHQKNVDFVSREISGMGFYSSSTLVFNY